VTWGLGSYPAVTLSDARIAAADARKLIAQNVDPSTPAPPPGRLRNQIRLSATLRGS
jgi:Arm DNA-binding domain